MTARRADVSDPRRIFEVLAANAVDYVVIGGLAVIAHGHTRNTRDVDLVVRRERQNFERLARSLDELDARLSGTDAHLLDIDVRDPETLANGASFTLETDVGGLDILNDVPGAAPYDELRDRAIDLDVGGVSIRVACLADVIRMKVASGRPQDLDDIAALTARRD